MKYSFLTLAFLGTLAGCATVPNGPSVAVMPGQGKSFEQFNADDDVCRQFAQKSIGTTAAQNSTNAEVASIAAGTALGAVAGALVGGHQNIGTGAAIGMVGGASIGSGEAQYSGRETQRRYDIAYEQCMYAKGHQLPQAAAYRPRVVYEQAPAPAPAPVQAPAYYPPPPPPPGR